MKIKRPDGKIHEVKEWDKIIKDVMSENNDANDYYYSWVELGENSLEDILIEALDLSFEDTPVLVKIRKGGVYIEKIV
jgi:hypothetical protein